MAKGDREASARQALENFRLFGAPHLAVVTSPEALGTHGVMDCGAWVSNFMLAGTALGIGSIAQAAIASWPDILRAHLPIPADRRVVCGISFGYEDSSDPANLLALFIVGPNAGKYVAAKQRQLNFLLAIAPTMGRSN